MTEAVLDAPAVAATTAAPVESLIHGTPAAPAAAPTADGADAFTFAEKVFAKTAEGAPDWEATAKNAEKARQHLEKRLGTGDVPPASAAEYAFTLPEEMKDFDLKSERMEAFKTEALANGITGSQFEWLMGSYLKAVPDLMDGAAKMTASQAREALAAVWPTPGDMETGIGNASRALRGLPADLQAATVDLGTNPAFLRAMAFYGAQTREDTPPNGGNAPSAVSVETLQASEAYRNQRHPDHARVSEQVRQHFARVHGDKPA